LLRGSAAVRFAARCIKQVEDFPALIAINDNGNDFFKQRRLG